MKMKIYVIHDSKADAFMQPFFLNEDEQAIRGFSDSVNNQESPFHNHAGDYTLYKIGDYSEETGTIQGMDKTSLVNGIDVKKQSTDINQLTLELINELKKVQHG